MAAPISVAMIGLGRMGQVHARILAQGVEGARLTALADVDAERARLAAEQLGVARWFDDPDELLAAGDVQAVVIAAPSHLHLGLVQAAARAGMAILCEKPLALTLAETDRAITAAARAGVPLQVGFMRRTQPAYLGMKQAIEAGEVGWPSLFRSTQRDSEAPPASFCDPAVSGGILVDMGIHEFDLGRWLLRDEVESVQAFVGAGVFPEIAAVGDYDSAVVNLRFRGGAVGTVDLSRGARYGEDIRSEVVGSKGGTFAGAPPGSRLPAWPMADDAYRPQMQAFVNAVRSGGPLVATGADSRAALAIGLAARRSAESGGVVSL
ncbi:MAG: Gfo/Idh/MocA family protein [Anaerolineales bacterium]